MLLGEESFMGRSLKLDFQRSGTYHVLVVSRLKVGILALVALWALRRFHAGQVVPSVLTIALIAGYAILTDVGAPVWRAALMLAIYLTARLLYRQRSTLNAIGAAGLALLIIDPKQFLGASFQLSFLCVLIIAGIAMPLLDRTLQPYSRATRHLDATGYDMALEPSLTQWRLDLRMIADRLARFMGGRSPIKVIAIAAGGPNSLEGSPSSWSGDRLAQGGRPIRNGRQYGTHSCA
jgi:competence protein ComEC